MIKPTPRRIQTVYLALMLLSTLATSLIWGINTLFLLDAGLSNTEAFLANSFFTIGQVLFEIPTGMVADVRGRRTSYLLGTITLAASTLLYLWAWQLHAGLWLWGVSSVLLGLGFTFFSGATEAWLVDALEYAGYKGSMETVFGRGQSMSGVAMLAGSVGGGLLAQATNLSVPYIVRAILLVVTFGVAFVFMKDWGFKSSQKTNWINDVRSLFKTSLKFGLRNPAVRWVMLAAPFASGVGFYAFYAMQPYLLELYKNDKAYAIAGLAAAIVAGAQIIGGLAVPYLKKVFKRRTSVLIAGTILNGGLLLLIGLATNFWIAIGLLCVWGLVFAATLPVRQAYLNALIPSKQRATVLSFDNVMGSAGGVVIQPVLGRAADVWSYASSFLVGAMIQTIALPFTFLARREKTRADTV
jgi:MFS family permease